MKTARCLQELLQQENIKAIISRCDSTDGRINAKLVAGCRYETVIDTAANVVQVYFVESDGFRYMQLVGKI